MKLDFGVILPSRTSQVIEGLCKSDEELIFPNHLSFRSPEDQELYISNWLEGRIGFKADFRSSFYPGKFPEDGRSIIPAGDTSQFIPSRDADIALFEEPEHLNCYHPGTQDLPKSLVCNVHGHKIDLDEDAHEVQSAAKGLNLDVNVMKGRDDTDDSLHGATLCTAMTELLQWVNSDHHEYSRYSQACLTYIRTEDVVAKFKEVMSGEPQPLAPEEQYKLSWEAATPRFLEFSDLDKVLSSETRLAGDVGRALY